MSFSVLRLAVVGLFPCSGLFDKEVMKLEVPPFTCKSDGFSL